MTIGEWLDTRTPAPPEALRVALRGALGPALARDAGAVADASIAAAVGLLEHTLAAGCRDRAQAMSLLAADALVTYAFEAAADEPDLLGERAARAVERLARLAVTVPPGGRDGAGDAGGPVV